MAGKLKIGFIGAGMMAQALCRGFISAGLVRASDILASDLNEEKLQIIKELGVETTTNNQDVVGNQNMVYLATKPFTAAEVLLEVAPSFTDRNLLISIAAGITIDTMETHLPKGSRVVRVMPNTPAVVQSACCVFSRGKHVRQEDAESVTSMLKCVGLVEEMPEYLLDAVTGLSGNGPAYGYVFMQALADGGVKMGLNRDQAIRLAAQTMYGASKMLLAREGHPEKMKDEVCSPGGTSIHALHLLEKAGFRGGLMDAVEAGTKRSAEIGEKFTTRSKRQHEENDHVNTF